MSKWVIAAFLASAVAGCTPEINHRGYYAKPGAFGQIREGMGKSEVEGILGSPSTTASINFQGDSYYYITSVTEQRSFLKPKEVAREVVAIRFTREDQVQSFAQYGLQDGRVIDMNTNQTPVAGMETSILAELFGTVSHAGPSTSMLGRRM